MKKILDGNKVRIIAKVSILIIYLALIRSLIEPFRLNYIDEKTDFQALTPFLLGALISGLFTLIMVIAFYYRKPKLVIALSIICVILMILIKIKTS